MSSRAGDIFSADNEFIELALQSQRANDLLARRTHSGRDIAALTRTASGLETTSVIRVYAVERVAAKRRSRSWPSISTIVSGKGDSRDDDGRFRLRTQRSAVVCNRVVGRVPGDAGQ